MISQSILSELGIQLEVFRVYQGCDGFGSIYISSYYSAMQSHLLQKHGINSVLSIAKGYCIKYDQQKVSNYLYIPVEDKKTQIISKHFQKCFHFMDLCRQRGNVLVHCKAGVSRSGTIIIGYLMYKFGYSLEQAQMIARQANPKIKPNIGFMGQLEKYEKKLMGLEENPEDTESLGADDNRRKKSNGQGQELKKYNKKQVLNCIQQLLKEQQQLQNNINSVNNFIRKIKEKSLNRSEYLQTKLKTYQLKRGLFIS